jgi:hypothetical protein
MTPKHHRSYARYVRNNTATNIGASPLVS